MDFTLFAHPIATFSPSLSRHALFRLLARNEEQHQELMHLREQLRAVYQSTTVGFGAELLVDDNAAVATTTAGPASGFTGGRIVTGEEQKKPATVRFSYCDALMVACC